MAAQMARTPANEPATVRGAAPAKVAGFGAEVVETAALGLVPEPE